MWFRAVKRVAVSLLAACCSISLTMNAFTYPAVAVDDSVVPNVTDPDGRFVLSPFAGPLGQ